MPDVIRWHSQTARAFDDEYARSARFHERYAVFSQLIDGYLPAGGQMLDAGCGPGWLSAAAAPRAGKIVAFDPSPEMLALAKRRLEAFGEIAEVRIGRVEEATLFGPSRFDLVLCSSVLEYVQDFALCLRELASAAKPGGHLLVSLPNTASRYRALERLAYGATGYPKYYRYIRNLLDLQSVSEVTRAEGLELIAHRTYCAPPIVGPLSRVLNLERYTDSLIVLVLRRSSPI